METNIKKALEWFLKNGFNAYTCEGDLYITIERWNIQVSSSEINYRADLYDAFYKES